MRRLFWVGVGVTITVVVIVRGRRVVAKFAPASLVDQAETKAHEFGERLTEAVADFKIDFSAARDEREKELLDGLLADTQGDYDDLRERRDAYARSHGASPEPAYRRVDTPTPPAARAGRHHHPDGFADGRDVAQDDDPGRRDDVEQRLGYSF